MTPAALLRQRLVRQGLVSSTWRTPADAVAALGAVQAQDFGMAKWALGLRVPSADETAIDRAFDAGDFLRTHVLRPTWHFVAPADVRWMLALTAPRIHAAAASHRRQLGLDRGIFRRSEKALTRALAGGLALDRYALEAVLRNAGLNTATPRLPHLLMHAELEGLIVSGPRQSGRATYMLLDARVPPPPPRSHADAVAELARRYFQSRAPATVQDFAWWSGLTTRDARAGAAALGPDFATETIDGLRYIVPVVPARSPASTAGVLLLPAYDEYAIAYARRDALFAPTHLRPKAAAAGVVFSPKLVLEGRIAGVWRPREGKKSVTIGIAPDTPLTGAQHRALDRAVRGYGRFRGRSATWTLASRPRSSPAKP